MSSECELLVSTGPRHWRPSSNGSRFRPGLFGHMVLTDRDAYVRLAEQPTNAQHFTAVAMRELLPAAVSPLLFYDLWIVYDSKHVCIPWMTTASL